MTITQYYPWNHSHRLQNDLKQIFTRFVGEDVVAQANGATSQWIPRVDIKEEHKRFVILADIPGVDPKNIDVSMDKGVLSIKGERSSESKSENTTDGSSTENSKFTRVERSHGVFQRRFALPDSADAEGITATGQHGVLEISIPKKAETTPRRININH